LSKSVGPMATTRRIYPTCCSPGNEANVSARDILLALLVVVLWGLSFIAIKWGVGVAPPLLLTALRFFFAAVPAVFFVKPPKVRLSILVLYGLMTGVFQFGTVFVAIKFGMPAGLASLIVQMQAFFTVGFAVAVLGERPGWAQGIGAAIALAGILVIAAERVGGAALWPFLLTLVSAMCWGVANIATKRAGQIDMLAYVAWSSLVAPLPLRVASLILEGPAADWAALTSGGPTLVGVVAFNSYAATLVGFGLWSVLLARYPASTVAPFSLLVPVVGIGASVMLLGERVSLLEAIGSAVIFSGLLINVFGGRLKRMRAAPSAGQATGRING
jgi:O-acetylserine/cysteine efflux transporter